MLCDHSLYCHDNTRGTELNNLYADWALHIFYLLKPSSPLSSFVTIFSFLFLVPGSLGSNKAISKSRIGMPCMPLYTLRESKPYTFQAQHRRVRPFSSQLFSKGWFLSFEVKSVNPKQTLKQEYITYCQ